MNTSLMDRKLSVDQIMAFDDEQLDEYLLASDRFISVKDPDNITEEFIQRLRARVSNAQSQPIDSQQLMARLADLPSYEERHSRSPSLATTVMITEEEELQFTRQLQSEAYQKLVESGGRPSHPIERMDDVVDNPGELTEILTFWRRQARGFDWEVYHPQHMRWLNFLRVQQYARQGRVNHERDFCTAKRYETWDKFAQAHPELASGNRGFPEYVQSAKQRLSRNGFTRSFELNQDIAQQDKLTTWIEFLSWEYMYYEHDTRQTRRRQKAHDKAWKKLEDSGVLKSGETEEILSTFEYGLERSAEQDKAEQAVEVAKRKMSRAQEAINSQHRLEEFQQTPQLVDAAQEDLDAAEEVLGRLKHRNGRIHEFLRATKNYRIVSRNAENHGMLIRWMLQQVPLIEQELELSDASSHPKVAAHDAVVAVEDSSEAIGCDAPRSSRKGRESQSDDDQQPSKRTKHEVDNFEGSVKRPAVSKTDKTALSLAVQSGAERQSIQDP